MKVLHKITTTAHTQLEGDQEEEKENDERQQITCEATPDKDLTIKVITRDTQKWKLSKTEPKTCYSSEFTSGEREEEDDMYAIGGDSDAASSREEPKASRSDVTLTISNEMTPPPDLRRSTKER